MIYIPPIPELSVPEVYDAGVGNRERIVFRPTEQTNLGLYGILIGAEGSDGGVNPINNWFFWFNVREIKPPCWVVVFTGNGEPKFEPINDNGKIVHFFYWNRDNTLFGAPNIKPVLVRIDSMHVANKFPSLKAGETVKALPKPT